MKNCLHKKLHELGINRQHACKMLPVLVQLDFNIREWSDIGKPTFFQALDIPAGESDSDPVNWSLFLGCLAIFVHGLQHK